jgi:hypothetical protein
VIEVFRSEEFVNHIDFVAEPNVFVEAAGGGFIGLRRGCESHAGNQQQNESADHLLDFG